MLLDLFFLFSFSVLNGDKSASSLETITFITYADGTTVRQELDDNIDCVVTYSYKSGTFNEVGSGC